MAGEWLHVLLPGSNGLSDSHVGLSLQVRLVEAKKVSRPVGNRLLRVRAPDLREVRVPRAPKHGEEHNARRSSGAPWLAEPVVDPPDTVAKGQRVIGVVVVVREALLDQADGRGRSSRLGGAGDAGGLCGRRCGLGGCGGRPAAALQGKAGAGACGADYFGMVTAGAVVLCSLDQSGVWM